MKRFLSAISLAILTMGISAHAQLNLYPNQITFRTWDNPYNTTTHYGDLLLSGGSSGLGWGWLTTNRVFSYGNVIVSGDLSVSGTKQFVQAHPTDTTKAISYVAIESGEALTLARGTSRTVGGIAKVDLPEDFGLVTSDKTPLTVLLTAEGAPALIFVKSKSKEGITVEVKPSNLKDYGDVDFSYQVTGVRDGFENHTAIIPVEEVVAPKETTRTSFANKRIKEFNERIQKIHSTSKARK